MPTSLVGQGHRQGLYGLLTTSLMSRQSEHSHRTGTTDAPGRIHHNSQFWRHGADWLQLRLDDFHFELGALHVVDDPGFSTAKRRRCRTEPANVASGGC